MELIDSRIQAVDPTQVPPDVLAPAEEPPAPLRNVVAAPAEAKFKRHLFLLFALAITAGFAFFIFSFSAPAPGRGGIDENAYLVGGRMIAEHATTGFKPSDDYQFVGAMWVRTAAGWYYPKYPFGTSLLNAIPFLFHKAELAFSVSPLTTVLAVLGMFFLARETVGSFYALLSMLVLAMGPTTLQFAILPDSHAPALCFVVWGMYFLLRWWRTGGWPSGVAAGLCLGFAVTIRYTEALLLFPLYPLSILRTDGYIGPKLMMCLKPLALLPIGPLGLAVLWRLEKWKSWRAWLRAGVPVIAWGVPVGVLVTFNWFTLGHFTGYDSTNESSGFAIKYFVQKWDFAIYQIYLLGLFVFMPLGIAGLIAMYRGHRRTALLLTMWFVPGALLYTAYYWGDGAPGVDYLRFFLTLFPPLIIAGMYLLKSAENLNINPPRKGSIALPLAAGVLTAAAAAVGVWGSLDELTRDHRGNMNFHYSAREIISHMQPSPGGRPMMITDEGMFPQFIQYMQFMVDADWYPSDIFALRGGGGFGLAGMFSKNKKEDDNNPVVLQRERMDYIDAFRKGKTDADFISDEHHLMDAALNNNRRVYIILTPRQADYFRNRFITSAYKMVEINKWSEPCDIKFPGPGEHSDLAPSTFPDTPILPWRPERRVMYEVKKGTATTQPSTAPAVALK